MAVNVWLPFASVPGIPATVPGIGVKEPKDEKLPVMAGLFVSLVTTAVTAKLCPKVIVVGDGVTVMVVGKSALRDKGAVVEDA